MSLANQFFHPNRLIAVLLCTIFALTIFTPAAAETSCGEADLSVEIDQDRDGETDVTVEFEKCVKRTFDYDGTEKKLVIYYTESNGRASDRLEPVDTDGDGVDDLDPDEAATLLADWTQEAWVTYRDYGFDDPLALDDFNVAVFDMRPGLAGWCCTGDPAKYHYNTPSFISALESDFRNASAIAFHEMWHASEWKGGFGGWVNEGTASNMTDHVNIPVDLDDSNDYISRVQSFLGRTDESLTDVSYVAALFWQYYMEQTGGVTTEPDRGRDAMKRFWDNLDTDGMTTLDNVIRGLADGRDIKTLWTDFTIANFAKELTGSSVPDKYRYRDELQMGAPDYPEVNLSLDEELLPGGDTILEFQDLQPWAARYHQFRPDPAVPFIDLQFTQETSRELAYTLLIIKDDDIVEEIRSVGRDFTQNVVNDEYDRIVVIVSSFQQLANYRYTVNATDPFLEIADPLPWRRAMAGDPTTPDKILIKVDLLNPDGTPIPGADFDDFSFTVETEPVSPADVVSTAYIQGQYWFLIRPPAQAAAGVYDLTLDYTELSQTSANSVSYWPRDDSDNVLVVDRSGSMGDNNKLLSAQDAARLYVDSWRDGDQVGVVSYDGDIVPDVELGPFTTQRVPALVAIDDLIADGGTTIGGGLLGGLDEFIARGVDDPATANDHSWDMILLSDGVNTVDPPISDFLDVYNDRTNEGDKVPRVHTIALGPDADRQAMQDIADATGGTYQFAAEPEAPSTAAARPGGSAKLTATSQERMFTDLSEIYRVISETVARHQQIYSATDNLELTAGGFDDHVIAVDGGAREGVFVVSFPTFSGANPFVEFIDPAGDVQGSPTLADAGHAVWRIANPMAGDWTMRVWGQGQIINVQAVSNPDGPPFLVEAALESELTMETFLGLAPRDRLAGRAMPILVSLAGNAPVSGATVSVEIRDPSGATSILALYDDGFHDDGAADDGFYGNSFATTAQAGSYVFSVRATGTTPLGDAFNRRQRGAFDMLMGPDGDGDGLPDWWEILFGTDPDTEDAGEDTDLDGLTHAQEFELGTHPNDADSDGSGESDGSEVANGGDPTDATDDAVVCPLDFQVDNHLQIFREQEINPLASVLNWSIDDSHDHYRIWRSTSADGPWLLIDDNAPPVREYLDDDVVLGDTYYYQVQAVDAAGRASCILGPRNTTPSEGALPPEGLVRINDGAPTTQSLEVMLTLDASTDTTEMLISSQASFDDATWQPYQAMLPWTLNPEDNRGVVFVLYRDAEGNDSGVVSDSIRIVPTCSAAVPSVDALWPPRHWMVPVDILGVTDPDGDPVTLTVTGIFQDERTNGRGDGNTCPDASGVGTDSVRLRAERSGTKRHGGDGRVYHIEFMASDSAGAACTDTVQVCVPVDRGGRHACKDQGPIYDSTSCLRAAKGVR